MGNRKRDPAKETANPEYLTKRARNNEAVKRSREKSRQKAKETQDRVSNLKQENEMLEERIKLLSKELTFLKDIFLAHAGSSHGLCPDDLDIKTLLRDDEDDEALGKNNPMSTGTTSSSNFMEEIQEGSSNLSS